MPTFFPRQSTLPNLTSVLSWLLLLAVGSACSIAPDMPQPKVPQATGTQHDVGYPVVSHYENIFVVLMDADYHTQLPDWMQFDGTSYKNPKPSDMPGDYQPPANSNPNWLGASISAPLPDENGNANPNLVSTFNYVADYNLYVRGIKVYLNGDLPRTANGDYRSFRLVSIDPIPAQFPYFKFNITYEVQVLSAGPGGPIMDIEPRRTVTAVYDFSVGGGDYYL